MSNFLHTTLTARKLGFLVVALILAAAIGTPLSAQSSDSTAALTDQELIASLSGPPSTAQACITWTEYVNYYSDATKTQQVGWCEFACYCQTYCEGQQTSFYTRYIYRGCL